VLRHRNLLVRQILSGRNDERIGFVQDDDEWVVVLGGAAVLEVDGEQLDLAPGDWVFLPARVPHSVVRTEAGTNWLAVHLSP
jgi:quercetin dioxygenase-like cupin family protein